MTCLDDELAGQLFKGLFAFACDGECTDFGNKALSGIYQSMIQLIAVDDEKYMKKCKQNAENAKQGGKISRKKESFTRETTESERIPTQANVSERLPLEANASQRKPIGNDKIGEDMTGEGEDKIRKEETKTREEEQQAVQKAMHKEFLAAKERIKEQCKSFDD